MKTTPLHPHKVISCLTLFFLLLTSYLLIYSIRKSCRFCLQNICHRLVIQLFFFSYSTLNYLCKGNNSFWKSFVHEDILHNNVIEKNNKIKNNEMFKREKRDKLILNVTVNKWYSVSWHGLRFCWFHSITFCWFHNLCVLGLWLIFSSLCLLHNMKQYETDTCVTDH